MADLTIHAAEDIELEQLDGLALDDAADGVPSNDDKLDVYAEWIFSDERDAWLAAEALGEKREARASKRLQDTSEAQALAEKVIERVAREATASVIQAAISIYTFLSNQWIRLCPLFLTLRESTGPVPRLAYKPSARASLPAWALDTPSDAVLALLPELLRPSIVCNLILVICFALLLDPSQQTHLLNCIATDSRLSINDITSLDAADPVHGNVMGIYGFSFDMNSWYIGRVAQQPMYSRMQQHGQHGVNRIIRNLLNITPWVSATKRVVLAIPQVWKEQDVPLVFFTQILEPMYIAFTRSLERPTKMQYNLLDLVGWESKASVSVIVRGWMKVVDWSRGSNGNDTRRLFPSVDQPYDRRWEELFGSFFDDKLSGHSIGRIVMGRRRFGITSKLPRPSRDAYLDPPLRLFPVGSKLVSPPRPSTSAAGPSTSTSAPLSPSKKPFKLQLPATMNASRRGAIQSAAKAPLTFKKRSGGGDEGSGSSQLKKKSKKK